MPERTIIKHVKHPFKEQYMGTIAVIVPADGCLRFGFAQCHPDDQFSKKAGRDKALGRARAVHFPKNKDGQDLRPVPVKFFNVDGSKYKVDVIGDEITCLLEEVQNEG